MAIHGAERHAKLKRFSSIFPPCIPREQGAGNPRIFNPLRDARFHLTKRNDYPYYGENICRGEAQAYACVYAESSDTTIFSTSGFVLKILSWKTKESLSKNRNRWWQCHWCNILYGRFTLVRKGSHRVDYSARSGK